MKASRWPALGVVGDALAAVPLTVDEAGAAESVPLAFLDFPVYSFVTTPVLFVHEGAGAGEVRKVISAH